MSPDHWFSGPLISDGSLLKPLLPNGSCRAVLRFNSEVIVDCLYQSLPRAQISFCSFYRTVAEQELNLFKFPSCGMTQPCASSAQVVRRQIVDTHELCVFTNNPPDRFLTEAVTPKRGRFC